MPEDSNFLKAGNVQDIKQLWEMARAQNAASRDVYKADTFMVGDAYHDRLVKNYDELDRYYVDASQSFYEETQDNYDLYLAQVPDKRSKDELWRSNIFVPLPGTNLETKVASEANIITRADPLFQIEGVTDQDKDTAHDIELLLDYTHRINSFRRFFIKVRRAVGIQGMDFIKPVWTKRSHNVMVWTSKEEKEDFLKRMEEAIKNGAPSPPDYGEDPKGFEKWRLEVNLVKKTARPIPEFPADGPRQIVTFEGPELIRLPLHSVHVDPLIDEMKDQDHVFYRTLVSLEWVLERTGVEPDKPFRPEQVASAMHQWSGEDLERYDREVSKKLGFNPMERQYADPFYKQAVEIVEVYDQNPSSPVKFGIMLNRRAIINKDYGEFPSWTGDCLITPIRNMQLPGHFPGISDFKWPRSLYQELRHVRNMRSDFLTLTVLPAWTKLKEAGIPELIRKISPGAILEVQRHDAIRVMDKPSLPNEAYREPAEIKAEIADAHGIWDQTKGAPATVGRVTGVEFQGRAEQAQLRLLLGTAVFEEEYQPVLRQMISFYAQNYRDKMRVGYGSGILDIPREDLIQALSKNFRMRGVTMALDRNLQAQQLMMVAEKFAPSLPPMSNFKLLKLILETLNIRGLESIISVEDEQAKTAEGAAASAAGTAGSQEATDQSAEAGVDVGTAGEAAPVPPGGQPPQ